jgi:glucose/arabinose dehydrogenase
MRQSIVLAAAAVTLVVACTAVKDDQQGTPVTDPLAPSSTLTPGQTTVPPTTLPPIDLGQVHVALTEVVELSEPTALASRGGDPAVFITERAGRVRRIDIGGRPSGSNPSTTIPTYTLDRQAVLDITDDVFTEGSEQGLLGITFSTDGNRMYVAYTGTDQNQHLDEYRMSDERADTRSRRELLVIPDVAENHNGGALAFGPDGFLYWSMGDGGGAGDPNGSGQNPTDLLGNLLRIDPDVLADSPTPYAIPDGNPFRSAEGGAPEVWTYGLRNPWRFSFDRLTGDLWIADVGQGDVEEIDYLPGSPSRPAGRAANLGWSLREGDRPFNGGEEPAGAIDPILTYDHSVGGCAITGGYVYRGSKIPTLVGAYVWADYCLGEVQALVQSDGAVVAQHDLGVHADQLSSFGQDNDGELWVLSLAGPVYRLTQG